MGGKGHVRAVPRVAEGQETGRLEAIEAGGQTVPTDLRYSWTSGYPLFNMSMLPVTELSMPMSLGQSQVPTLQLRK